MACILSWTFLPLCDDGADPLQGLRARKESVVIMADLADWGQSEGKMATQWHGPCDIRNRTSQRRVERGKMPQWSGLQRPYKKRQENAEPGAPHTSGIYLSKVHGVREGTVGLEGSHKSR